MELRLRNRPVDFKETDLHSLLVAANRPGIFGSFDPYLLLQKTD
jgi:hypothetical protein